jgi:hypothetical protein
MAELMGKDANIYSISCELGHDSALAYRKNINAEPISTLTRSRFCINPLLIKSLGDGDMQEALKGDFQLLLRTV